MKFSCKVVGLMKGIAPVFEASTHGAMKDFDGANKIKLEATKDELLVSTFNGRVAVRNVISDLTVNDICYSFVSSPGDVIVNSTDFQNVLMSFDPSETIVIEIKGSGKSREFVVSRETDKEEFQTLPCLSSDINIPSKSDKFSSSVIVDREGFVYAVNKILFAIGFEKDVERYLHWVLRAGKGKARFVAGTGARFAILDIEGDNFIQTKPKDINFLFPKEHTLPVIKVLATLKDEKLSIKQTDPKTKGFQLVLEVGSLEIIFVELNPNISFPDENKIINMPFTHRFVTKISDWKYVGNGIVATFNDELKKERRPHYASVDIDDSNTTMIVKTNEIMKASRKVPILDSSIKNNSNIHFSCGSSYLKEIAESNTGGTNIQMEMFDEPKKPVIIRYHALDKVKDASVLRLDNESLNISEKFTIFFATVAN